MTNSTDEKPEAVIFDVDGTLCDVRPIRHYVDGTNGVRNFDAFHRASQFCDPNPEVARDLLQYHEDAIFILVVTGRDEKYRMLTINWLTANGIPFSALRMRPFGDRRKDFAVKKDILDELRQSYDIVHAWDDNPAIIALWESEGIPVTVVPGWEE